MTLVRDRLHALYRFFGSDDALLYVGITCDPGRRWSEHSKDKPWWAEVTKTTVELFPSRDAVLAAEASAIQTESPKYNFLFGARRQTATQRDLNVDEFHHIRVLIEQAAQAFADPLVVTIEGAARALSTSQSTVKRLVRSGALPVVRIAPGQRRIRVKDISKYLEAP